MNAFELQSIAAAGGGVVIDARNYNAFEMQQIAEKAEALILIKNASKFNAFECQTIAQKGRGKVVFDFIVSE